MKKILLLLLCLLPLIISAQSKTVTVKTDFGGNVTEGSIDELIVAIQNGATVRVGWGLDFDEDNIADLEHWIDANFLTVMNGHVFNQIDAIYQQAPKRSIPQVKIMPANTMWMGVIGTNGKLMHRYIVEDLGNLADEAMVEKMMKRAAVKEMIVSTVWVAKY